MKLAFLAVLLVFLVLPLAHASAGLSYSDYDTKLVVNRPISFAVGKVTNIGNETLVFSYVWKQTNSTVNMTLPITSGDNYTAEPGQSFEPTITIGDYNESLAGNYSGVVDIKGSYRVPGGDMVVPGAECHVTLIVDPSEQQNQQYTERLLVVSLICIIAIVFGLVALVAKSKLKKSHVQPSGPFRLFWRKFR